MKITLLALVIGALSIATADACSCPSKHPQRHFCDAQFAMMVTLSSEVPRSDVSKMKQYTAEVVTSWKGPAESTFEFYSPAFCGSVFKKGETYVITGTRNSTTDGRKYWLHGSCDYMSPVDEMSAHQINGFERKYAKHCNCPVPTALVASDIPVDEMAKNEYSEARTYWTPTGCYYNPVKTMEYSVRSDAVKDCEDQEGLCKRERAGECNWVLTPEYETCFKNRDDFVMVESSDFAIGDISQCAVFKNKHKRKNCRRRFKQQEQQQMGFDEEAILYL